MSTHDRVCETVCPDGQEVIIVKESSGRRIAEGLAKSADESERK